MKSVIYFVALCLTSVYTDMAGECDMAGFYLELGCSATRVSNSSACPDSFVCPDLHPDPTMCYYRGVPYADRATIPQELIANPCSRACRCDVRDQPRFECAAVDCVETFGSDQQQCVSTYELDSCCSVGNVCGKDAIASLKTCEVDGQTYKEGESFEPKNTHKSCVCTAEWDGNTENPAVCRDINCGLEIHYQDMLLENCAPVFVGNQRGCPISFTCPTPATKVIRRLNVRGISSECAFGNVTLGVGDELVVAETCTTCSCLVPPFVSCMMKAGCSN